MFIPLPSLSHSNIILLNERGLQNDRVKGWMKTKCRALEYEGNIPSGEWEKQHVLTWPPLLLGTSLLSQAHNTTRAREPSWMHQPLAMKRKYYHGNTVHLSGWTERNLKGRFAKVRMCEVCNSHRRKRQLVSHLTFFGASISWNGFVRVGAQLLRSSYCRHTTTRSVHTSYKCNGRSLSTLHSFSIPLSLYPTPSSSPFSIFCRLPSSPPLFAH